MILILLKKNLIKNISMKTSLLFSGQLRGFKHVVENINKNIISNLGDVDAYFYITGKVEDTSHLNCNTYIKEFVDEDYDVSRLTMENPNKEFQKRFVGQFYALKQCKNFMKEHNKNYDLVVRIRPDSFFEKELTMDMIDKSKINISDFHQWGGINDRFAIGPQKEMEIYCDMVDSIFDIGGNAEKKLKHHLNKHKVPVNLINFHHLRVDVDGKKR